jgi:Xaa-Pro aminopeptidase
MFTGSTGRHTRKPLLPGMILSNEPGYYKAGEFGIRIENLILVEERQIDGRGGRMAASKTSPGPRSTAHWSTPA